LNLDKDEDTPKFAEEKKKADAAAEEEKAEKAKADAQVKADAETRARIDAMEARMPKILSDADIAELSRRLKAADLTVRKRTGFG
jgi:hypothetical protein